MSALPSVQTSGVANLRRVMALAGWEICYVDIDLTAARPQAEIKVMRDDGRWLWAKVDRVGRSSMETFQRERWLGIDPKNRQARLAPQVNDAFLGRQSFAEPMAMLHGLTAYLADNAMRPVALADVRAGWAALMGAPLQLEAGRMSAMAQTNKERQEALRARRAMLGMTEVRGIYLPPELHAELKAHAAKLLSAYKPKEKE